MAKYETRLRGDFDETLRYLHDGILDKSASASYEDESCVQCAGVRCCVRVYERYSWSGGNRLSMTLTLGGRWGGPVPVGHHLRRQQGMFFKFNTWGEEFFLDTLRELAEGRI